MASNPVFDRVGEVLNRYDPMGLLELGAPRDEYDNQTGDLARLVRGADPVTAEAVLAVFAHWFGAAGGVTADDAAAIAAELEGLRARR